MDGTLHCIAFSLFPVLLGIFSLLQFLFLSGLVEFYPVALLTENLEMTSDSSTVVIALHGLLETNQGFYPHIHLTEGLLGKMMEKLGKATYPLVPGHEIVGTVQEVGSEVQRFKVGDHVGVGGHMSTRAEIVSTATMSLKFIAQME
ncbi:hypothetical protein OIU78_003766 [Salix suchowensis]|nr:hypothetical protein OIU78_003766 [Salix suchowensis]